jgi:hypothetical protein
MHKCVEYILSISSYLMYATLYEYLMYFIILSLSRKSKEEEEADGSFVF